MYVPELQDFPCRFRQSQQFDATQFDGADDRAVVSLDDGLTSY